MQKLQMYQKLVFFTVLKFKWSIIAVFILAIISGVCLRYIQFKRSHHKFEGSVTLFYTPRACEEVKPLSINHILGVFSRQQIFHQLVEEMQLTDAFFTTGTGTGKQLRFSSVAAIRMIRDMILFLSMSLSQILCLSSQV
jgi:hypothetical protein